MFSLEVRKNIILSCKFLRKMSNTFGSDIPVLLCANYFFSMDPEVLLTTKHSEHTNGFALKVLKNVISHYIQNMDMVFQWILWRRFPNTGHVQNVHISIFVFNVVYSSNLIMRILSAYVLNSTSDNKWKYTSTIYLSFDNILLLLKILYGKTIMSESQCIEFQMSRGDGRKRLIQLFENK